MIKGKLSFFFDAKKPVYFKIIDDNFRNGTIVEILKDRLILDEVVLGTILIYFDEIQLNTIAESKSHRLNKEKKE